MKTPAVAVGYLFCWLVCLPALHALATDMKKPGPSPSDALFDPSRVIQIEIKMDPKDWHALRISHPTYSQDDHRVMGRSYEYYRGEVVIDGQALKSVGVRKKGTGSELTTRPALKIKFDEYVKGRDFGGLEMLTLNNLPFQASKAMQPLAYSFLNRAGAVSPRSNLARVIVNGEDLGVYGHVESIDKRFIKRHFGNAKGDLYEGQFGADLTTNDFKKLIHKWGPDDDLSQIGRLVNVLASPEPVSLKSIEEHIDLKSFLTFWAGTVLVGHVDCYPFNLNNYYLYRDANSGKFIFIPWGADVAFEYPGDRSLPRSVWANGQLCRRLWEIPEVRERYRNEMRRLLAGAWKEQTMREELDQIRRQRELAEPGRMATPLFGSTGPEALEGLARRLESRRNEVQAELDSPARDWPIPQAAPALKGGSPITPAMRVEGTFSAVIREAFPTNSAGFFGPGAATLQFTIAGDTRNPFTQSGAILVLRKHPFEFANELKLVVANAAGDLSWQVGFRLDPYRAPIVPGLRELGAWSGVRGDVSQSAPGSTNRQWRSGNTGTLELTQVSTNLGGTISGKFEIHTTAFEEEKKP